jgi:hypothetical protein
LGGIMLLALSMGNIVHPQRYALKILFITTLALKIPARFVIFIVLVPTSFLIRTTVNFFLFSKFLSAKVREWRPISNAKYRMEHNHYPVDDPGRALIYVFSNPSATEGYLSWGYLSKKLEFFAPY